MLFVTLFAGLFSVQPNLPDALMSPDTRLHRAQYAYGAQQDALQKELARQKASQDAAKRNGPVLPKLPAEVQLDGASDIIKQTFGVEIAHDGTDFIVGGLDIMRETLPNDHKSDARLNTIGIEFRTGETIRCSDMACVEDAIAKDPKFLRAPNMPIAPLSDRPALGPSVYVHVNGRTRLNAIRDAVETQITYTKVGFTLEDDGMTVAFVAGGSPAGQVGLSPGNVLTQVNAFGANFERTGAQAVAIGSPVTLRWRQSATAYGETKAGLVPKRGTLHLDAGLLALDTAGVEPWTMPEAFANFTEDRALMALFMAAPQLAPAPERRLAALRVLEGWSFNVNSRLCLEPPLLRIPVTTTLVTTTRNGFGIIKDQTASRDTEILYVEPRFAEFVQSMSRHLSSAESAGRMERAAAAFANEVGCDAPGMQRIRDEIAKLAN